MKLLPPFDKYEYYLRAVQEPDQTLDFIESTYRDHFGREAISFSEDFCGTFALSCAWAERGKRKTATAVDKSLGPIKYGMDNYLSALTEEQRKRVHVFQSDVSHPKLPKADIIAAMNFSYFIFKERKLLLNYFRNCYRRLNRKGLLALDCFGGSETQDPNLDEIKHRGFIYYWDQVTFDPITHSALFYIHFKRPGEKKRERVFRYDWRMWTLPELKDLLYDAGFKDVTVYWEGTSTTGGGDGVFKKKKREENCAAWLAYVTAKK